jgi:hypothetical protein
MRRTAVRSLVIAAAAGGLLCLGVVPASVASASSTVTVTYPVTGSTHINAIKSTLSLGPGTLTSTVNLKTSAVSAALSLPPATGSFKELGFIPVTATTQFIQDGAATGTADLKTNKVSVTSRTTLRITKLSVAGLPIPVGRRCETRTPASITVESQSGFTVLGGGNLAGTYTIPSFSHCGLATPLINLTIPGSGNTITLTLGAAKLS